MSQVPRKTTGSKRSAPASRAWDALTPSLSEWILEAVSSLGFARLTPVQATTIPLFTKNSDVVVEAVTGSGKTLAFLIPVVERLLRLEEPIKKHHVGAIIISPTRELATQIHNVLLSLLAFHPPSAVHLQPPAESSPLGTFEGANIPPPLAPSSSALRIVPQLLLGGTTTPSQDLAHFLNNSSNLLISTPGRLVELLSSPHVHCPQSSFEVLVMDEADRLLDLGFKEDLQKILQRVPKQRRTGLFSASMSEAVEQLVRVGLRNPVRIAVKVTGVGGGDDQRTPASLQLAYLTTPPTHKLPALISLLHHLQPTPTKTIVYLSTCASVDYFSHLLTSILPTNSTLSIIPLHGKHPDAVRSKNFNRFITTPTPTLLLTTDLAARGLDIPSVDLTIQLDPPSDPKTFLHRAGRAGRAGRKGLAVVFLLPGRESEDYPAFLAVRKTPVTPLAEVLISTTNVPSFFHLDRTEALDITDAKAKATTHALRKTILKDRALHDKAQRGFVSWVKAYSKHTASSIFRVADVAWTEQAEAWALLKLPKMPELKAYNKAHAQLQPPAEGAPAIADDKILDMEAPPPIQPTTQASPPLDTTLGLQIPWRTYAYLDPAKEAKRTAAFPLDPAVPTTTNVRNPTFAIPPPASTTNPTVRREAWSNNTDIRSVAAGRRERKAAKRERVREGGLSAEQRAKEEEVKAMVERVRKGVLAGEADEFMGFAD